MPDKDYQYGTYTWQGTLMFNEKPLYLVKVVTHKGTSTAFVYEPDIKWYEESMKQTGGKMPIVRPAWSTVTVRSGYVPATELGALASSTAGTKRIRREKPHIFSAPIQQGISTFSGIEGQGFIERVPSNVKGENKKYIGQPTNVFIALDDLKFKTEPTVSATSILEERGIGAQNRGFFSL